MNFKKLEQIRKRAKNIEMGTPAYGLAEDILWLCRQIRKLPKCKRCDQPFQRHDKKFGHGLDTVCMGYLPKFKYQEMSKKEYQSLYPISIEKYGKAVLKTVRDFKPTKMEYIRNPFAAVRIKIDKHEWPDLFITDGKTRPKKRNK